MIHVEHLVKRYGPHTALANLSFDVARGEILGLLGPNGAGKTTAMRILTCFLPASAGVAEVAGHDVSVEPLEVRRHLGYLPENVPLYPEMRVEEYLDFRARLKRVPRARRRDRTREVASRCGLEPVLRKPIAALSKGYRQRVGLADALVADPPILILDEPTAGLDPNQIRQVRALIRELGRDRTIVLSTHILPEVEMTCGRVLILSEGKMVTQDTPARLRERLEGRSRLVVELRGVDAAAGIALLSRIPGVEQVTVSEGKHQVEVAPGRDVREEIFRAVAHAGLTLVELRADAMTLEEIFVRLTSQETPEEAASAGAGA